MPLVPRCFMRATTAAWALLVAFGAAGGAGPSAALARDAARKDLEEARALYKDMCAACHGTGGKGDGPAAAYLAVKPRDHTDAVYMGGLSDAHIFDVIKRGGAAVGKFAAMPAWGQALSERQIWDLVRYIRFLNGVGR